MLYNNRDKIEKMEKIKKNKIKIDDIKIDEEI